MELLQHRAEAETILTHLCYDAFQGKKSKLVQSLCHADNEEDLRTMAVKNDGKRQSVTGLERFCLLRSSRKQDGRKLANGQTS